jgi:hypothetical protein
MEQFERLNIKYTPAEIKNNLLSTGQASTGEVQSQELLEDEAIAAKLLEHLRIVQDYRDRVSAIDYLVDGAAKLAGNPQYTAKRDDLIKDIAFLGGNGDVVDFELFKKCTDLVIKGYQDMALITLTGVAND